MKLTKTGYRISKNGSVISGVEKEAFTTPIYLGRLTKQEGVYYFHNRRQGHLHVYLP